MKPDYFHFIIFCVRAGMNITLYKQIDHRVL
jgi:hypothetical protein